MKKTEIFLIIAVLIFGCKNTEQETFSIANLKCEHLIDPIGLDTESPRFSWQMQSNNKGIYQEAYQIVVSTDEHFLADKQIWDSGKINSDHSLVTYSGPELSPFTKYYWGVQVWDNDRSHAMSEIAAFETGMMQMSNWKGSWVTDTRDIELKAAPYFRREFKAAKEIRSAKAYVVAAGLFELSVNGNIIGNSKLDPTYTRFDRRNLYVTHEITEELKQGENAIGILLGNGWYNHQSTAVWYFHEASWRARPKFCMDIRITYEDGTVETIGSDRSWKTDLSPVIFNSIYTAEHYDGQLEQDGWDQAGFDDSSWKSAEYTTAPSKNITAQTLHPIRNVEEVIPVSMKKFNNRNYIYDLGKNISGVSELKISGLAGTRIELIHSELISEMGHADLSNIDVHYRPTDDSDPFQTDIFILRGEGEEVFSPKFNYKGFQYVEIKSSKPIDLHQTSLTGQFMHSDVPPRGKISSSNSTIDKIWQAGNSSYLANLFGYPTDCPQREKNGWTGDAHIAIETGLYSFDGITVYEKWMADHRDEQQPNGVLPAIIPTDGWGYHWANGPDWTSTIALIPWNVYLFYGDTKILSENYDNIKRYVDHIDELYPTGLTDWGLGDWVPVKSKSPKELTSTAYYYTDAIILSRVAGILGHQKDQEHYARLAEKIKSAFNIKYLDLSTGIYGSGFQTELSVPLMWGLVPDDMIDKVSTNLAKAIEAEDFHIDVGLLGSKAILNALSDNGYPEVAFKVASQETFPSWGWWIVNGATTFYENWDIEAKRDLSLNHIMFGEINAWFYKALGAIKPDANQPGFKNVLLEPHFVDGLNQFSAEHEGPYGKISSSWERTGKGIVYQITIPPNSSATVTISGKEILLDGANPNENEFAKVIYSEDEELQVQVTSGSFEFVIK